MRPRRAAKLAYRGHVPALARGQRLYEPAPCIPVAVHALARRRVAAPADGRPSETGGVDYPPVRRPFPHACRPRRRPAVNAPWNVAERRLPGPRGPAPEWLIPPPGRCLRPPCLRFRAPLIHARHATRRLKNTAGCAGAHSGPYGGVSRRREWRPRRRAARDWRRRGRPRPEACAAGPRVAGHATPALLPCGWAEQGRRRCGRAGLLAGAI